MIYDLRGTKGEDGMKRFVNYFEEYMIAAFIIAMAVLQTMNAVFRVFGIGIDGFLEELGKYAYVYVCFLSMAFCAKKGSNVAVRMISDKYKGGIQKILVPVRYVIDIVIAAIFLWGSIQYETAAATAGEIGKMTGIPLVVIYAAPIIGYLLCLIRNIQGVTAELKQSKA